MRNAQRYSFIPIDVALGEASFRPYLPLTLMIYQQSSAIASGLLDTGASVNVLPYSVGVCPLIDALISSQVSTLSGFES